MSLQTGSGGAPRAGRRSVSVGQVSKTGEGGGEEREHGRGEAHGKGREVGGVGGHCSTAVDKREKRDTLTKREGFENMETE